jgi:putative nucleotidyltransferase with HDIG domain
MFIRPWNKGRFSIYLKQGESYVLYTEKGEAFTESHRAKLSRMGIQQVYISAAQRQEYGQYLRENLGALLEDEEIPMPKRAQAWYQASSTMAKNICESKLPKSYTKKDFAQVQDILKASAAFFAKQDSLKQIAKFIKGGYKIYHHSLGVMVLTAFVLKTYEHADENLLVKCCMGSLLHDIGKATLPQDVLDADPQLLTDYQTALIKTHPSAGVGLCSTLPLSQEAINCILFHHERANGTGYPSGLTGEDLPFYVKVLSLCNVYDAATRPAAYRPAMSPFQALSSIKAYKEYYDMDAMKRLIVVLSDAKLT